MTSPNGDLLAPIPGDNPSGLSLRYDPVYDQIKVARREDDDLPQGDWQTSRKQADWPLVIRLATDALAKKSKDLQLAAWLTEAWLRREGFPGLQRGLDLMHEMLERYWDSVHPEVDDGDLEMRAAPLEWIALRLELPPNSSDVGLSQVRRVPLNQDGHSLVDYRECRRVPTREEADQDNERAEQRERAIAEGKITPEDFDRAFSATPKEWYRSLVADIDACSESLQKLDGFCSERFGDVAPRLAPVRDALGEVRQVAAQLFARKLEQEPDPLSDSPDVAPAGNAGASVGMSAAPVANVASGPRNRAEADAWVAAAARQIRKERPLEPTAYLLLRGFRWGELRNNEGRIDPKLLVPPSTETRTRLKGFLLDANWQELLNLAEEVMATPQGRGWLDLQRYGLTAIDGLGSEYEAVGTAIRHALRQLLADVPDLTTQTLMDDSPVANAETMSWLRDQQLLPEGADVPEMSPQRPSSAASRRDPFETALARKRAGDPRGATEFLMRAAAQEKSMRARFIRRVQAADIMVDSGMEPVALPILRELMDQIESYRLEDWESGDTVAQPLGLLYRCVVKGSASDLDASALYDRICRLDPLLGIQLGSENSGSGEGS